ncbi:universal stress protein [Arthrobacter sp. MDT1-48-3]|uniref:Universal stress protein n=1 Tax=Arthrobacter agilis TaxID=37921 RepID=A0A2L0UAH9_9MICC|nr:universal stress protein [Arthrobacter agilis]AUZ86239.1 universal stress protein [Arthrobacter agilis]
MRILVGYVPTDEGRTAALAAISEALLRSCDLLVVGPAADQQTPEADAEIRQLLAQASAAGPTARLHPLRADEDPADALIDLSYEDDVELVVIGVRRRSRVGKLFLGSTAQRVILEAGCAVHSVKPRLRDDKQ